MKNNISTVRDTTIRMLQSSTGEIYSILEEFSRMNLEQNLELTVNSSARFFYSSSSAGVEEFAGIREI